MNRFIRFIKNWTLPVAIVVGSVCYLTFYWIPALDTLGDLLSPIFDVIFPLFVFLTLLITFCKVDYHQLRPHRWHVGVLVAQLLLIAITIGVIFWVEENAEQKLLWEALLTCIIGPSASAAPVVVGKLGGNINTMTTYVILSSLASTILIPLVFPILEPTAGVAFLEAFLVILHKVAIVLLLPLVLGWFIKHYLPRLQRRIVAMPNLSFYTWAISLSITTGITVKNIVHSDATIQLLGWIAKKKKKKKDNPEEALQIKEVQKKSDPNKKLERFKIILLGEKGVGKTSLIERYVSNKFSNFEGPSMTDSVRTKKYDVDKNLTVELSINDSNEVEKLDKYPKSYYRDAHGAIIVFSLTDPNSFERITYWKEELDSNGERDVVCCYLGNQSDRTADRKVNLEEIKNKVDDNLYYDVSAKTGNNVSLAFEQLTINIIEKQKEEKKNNVDRVKRGKEGRQTLDLNQDKAAVEQSKKKCC